MHANSTQVTKSLYVHFPWCVQRCPYCDFNAHRAPADRSDMHYTHRLCADWDHEWSQHTHPPALHSVFLGGGTPSLWSPDALDHLLQHIAQDIPQLDQVEITLEANPQSSDQAHFSRYRALGVNRLSVGVQSFSSTALQRLGRIHDPQQASHALQAAARYFDHWNVDIMYGLPHQTVQDALDDLRHALAHHPPHLSWYQLTLEPHTPFHRHPPTLPDDDTIWAMQQEGLALLAQQGYVRYEVSAFRHRHAQPCLHNMHYWHHGDHWGIGAGASGKHTRWSGSQPVVTRRCKQKAPMRYMDPAQPWCNLTETLSPSAHVLEFLMNGLRLIEGVPWSHFEQQTGLARSVLDGFYQEGIAQQWLHRSDTRLQATTQGLNMLNSLLTLSPDLPG